jgi:hypothetical protein
MLRSQSKDIESLRDDLQELRRKEIAELNQTITDLRIELAMRAKEVEVGKWIGALLVTGLVGVSIWITEQIVWPILKSTFNLHD